MCVFAAPPLKKTLSFLPSFSVQFLLFEGGEMLCSAVFVSVVRQKKAFCVPGFTASDARKGKGTSLFDIFFPHAPLAGRCTRKIKDNSVPLLPPFLSFFPFFFQKAVSIWELYFLGLLTCRCVQGQYLSMAIMQLVICHKTGPTYLWRTHRLHDKSPPPRMSLSDSLCSILSGSGSRW